LQLVKLGYARNVSQLVNRLLADTLGVVAKSDKLLEDLSYDMLRKKHLKLSSNLDSKIVRVSEMQKFVGMMITEYKAGRGIYITTSDFTEPAKKLAQRHNVELWNGKKLANLIIEQRKRLADKS